MSDQQHQPQIPLPPVTRTSTLATISIITGILTWLIIPFIGAVVAIITGHMAKKDIRQNIGRVTGDGLATAGLVLGYAQLLVLCVPITCAFTLFLMDASAPDILYAPLRLLGIVP